MWLCVCVGVYVIIYREWIHVHCFVEHDWSDTVTMNHPADTPLLSALIVIPRDEDELAGGSR